MRSSTSLFVTVVLSLVAVSCRSPGSVGRKEFSSLSVLPRSDSTASRTFGSAVAVDLSSSLGDANASSMTVTSAGSIERIGTAPALAVRGNNDYVMAFSAMDTTYAARSAQSVFSAIPSVVNEVMSWPTFIGGYFYASPTPLYSTNPILSQVASGEGALLYLAGNHDGDGAMELFAWVRQAASNTWLGHGGSAGLSLNTGAPATLTSAAANQVNYRYHTLCPPVIAADGTGGFLVGWCAADDGVTSNAKQFFSYYSQFNGWSSAPIDLATTGAFDTLFGPQLDAGADAAGEEPVVGTGVAVDFAPDGSGIGWAAWVASATPATPEDYTVRLRLFNPATKGFYGTAMSDTSTNALDGLVANPTDNKLNFPLLFVEDGGDFTLFYVDSDPAAVPATGTLMKYYRQYTAPNATTGTAFYTDSHDAGDATAVEIDSVDNTVSFGTSLIGQYQGPVLSKSPAGSRGALIYASDDDTVVLRVTSGGGSWPSVKTFELPSNITQIAAVEVKTFDVAINDSGDMIVAIGYGAAALDVSVVALYYYAASSNTWSTQPGIFSSPSGSGVACAASTLKIKTIIDNNAKGLVAYSCLPVNVLGAAVATSRQMMVPLR